MKNLLQVSTALLALAGVSAADPPTQTPQALAADLAHPEYARREAAHRKLQELGAAASSALEAAAKSTDAEQRLRAEHLLLEIRRADLWQPSMVKLGPGAVRAEDAFLELAKQSGNPFKLSANMRALDGQVTLDGKPRRYWEALDDLCRQAEVAVNFYDDPTRSGGVVGRQQPGNFPVSYVGPFRVRIQTIRRNLTGEIHFGDGEPDVQDAWTLNLQMHWEQKTRLARYRGKPIVLEARTDAGDDMRPKSNQAQRQVWMPVHWRSREIAHPITLTPPSRKAAKLASLVLASEFVVVGDPTTIRVPLERAGGNASTDGFRLEVSSVERQAGSAKIVARVIRSEPLDVAINTADLVDERLSIAVGDREIAVSPSRAASSGRTMVEYTIPVPTGLSEKAELRLEVPRLRSVKQFQFAFRDVPLP